MKGAVFVCVYITIGKHVATSTYQLWYIRPQNEVFKYWQMSRWKKIIITHSGVNTTFNVCWCQVWLSFFSQYFERNLCFKKKKTNGERIHGRLRKTCWYYTRKVRGFSFYSSKWARIWLKKWRTDYICW